MGDKKEIKKIQKKIDKISTELYSKDAFEKLSMKQRSNKRASIDNLYEELRFYKEKGELN